MTTQYHSARCHYGFTLIEMLTVLVIIAILAQYLVSVSMQAREKAYRTTCVSNLRQLLQACKMYESDYGSLPIHCPGEWKGVQFGDMFWQLTVFPYVKSRDVYICPVDPTRGNSLYTAGGPLVSYCYCLTCPWLGPGGRYRAPKVRSPLILDPHHLPAGRVELIAFYDGSVEIAPVGRYESIGYEPEDGKGLIW